VFLLRTARRSLLSSRALLGGDVDSAGLLACHTERDPHLRLLSQ